MANEVLKNPLSERFRDAFEYANRMHRTQARKGTQIPYIAHPLAAAAPGSPGCTSNDTV